MYISSSKNLLEKLDGIIHEPVQRHDRQLDLTVNQIKKLKTKGKLDFGGSELQASETEEIKPEKKNEDDEYGWWTLKKGIYLIKYNERLKKDAVYLQPHNRLIKTGSYTIGRVISNTDEISDLLIVGENGLDIKENARIATAYNIE